MNNLYCWFICVRMRQMVVILVVLTLLVAKSLSLLVHLLDGLFVDSVSLSDSEET